jgi:acetolactate decarboxylase
MRALVARSEATGDPVETIVADALADALEPEPGTLFQVSAAGALVAGVTRGSITVADLLRHGDFGLGTFDDFDGEMVLLDSTPYQVTSDGVSVADDDVHVPYAVVTNFTADSAAHLGEVASFDDLADQLDAARTTDNEFFAVRLEGSFDHVKTRAVCKTRAATSLSDAAHDAAEFHLEDVDGVIVGFWSPKHVTSITVAGWHLHFIDRARRAGGHLFNCRGTEIELRMQRLADFHMAFPETPDFLHADLSPDVTEQLAEAETDHRS